MSYEAINRLHLEDKITAARVYLRWIKYAAVGFEPTASFVPTSTIESIEVVAPVEIKLVIELIICVNFDIVEEGVPRHVYRVEPSGPTLESRCPEVHP